MPNTNHMEYNKYGMVGHNNNQMTMLLNRIERRLGLSVLPLPDGLKKDDWARIIMEDSLPTFSQYLPYEITTVVRPTEASKDGYFFIDQDLPEGTRILGVRDIDFQAYRVDPRLDRYGMNVFSQDFLSREYAVDDVALTVVGNDLMSLFDNNIYISFIYPNRIHLESVNGFPVSQYRPFPLKLLIEHPGLYTLSPTYMETFTKLCCCDIATAVYQVLKYYDNMDTTYANLSLQLDTVQEWSNRRDDVIRELDEAHLTAANEHSALIMCV